MHKHGTLFLGPIFFSLSHWGLVLFNEVFYVPRNCPRSELPRSHDSSVNSVVTLWLMAQLSVLSRWGVHSLLGPCPAGVVLRELQSSVIMWDIGGRKEQPLSSKDTSKAAGTFKSYFMLLFLWLCFSAHRIWVPQPGMEHAPSAVKARSPNTEPPPEIPAACFTKEL